MSANDIVVFEEQTDGTFNAYHRDIGAWYKSQNKDGCVTGNIEQPIFQAATMRECVRKYEKWCDEMNETGAFPWIIEYGYVFELRADTETNPS